MNIAHSVIWQSALIALFWLISLLISPVFVYAQDPQYTPPTVSGAPSNRVGGGTRGIKNNVGHPVLVALAPANHTGWTLEKQPTLYWSLSQDSTETVEIMLSYADPVAAGSYDPVFKTLITHPQAGIHALKLSESKVELKANIEYEWTLTLLKNGKVTPDSITTTALLMVVEPQKIVGLADLLANEKPSGEKLVSLLAQKGIWYDAIATLETLILRNPEQASLRNQLTKLLEQVSLTTQLINNKDVVVNKPSKSTDS